MAKNIKVSYRGISRKIRKLRAVKNGGKYTEYQIDDYCTGKRVRHSRATLEQVKTKALEIAEAMVTGMREVLEWDERQRAGIRQALKLLTGTHLEIDRAAAIIADAMKLIEPDEILVACRAWRDHGPGKRFVPKTIKEAVEDFCDVRNY